VVGNARRRDRTADSFIITQVSLLVKPLRQLKCELVSEVVDAVLVVLLEVATLLHSLIVVKGVQDDGEVFYRQVEFHNKGWLQATLA